MRPWLIRYLHQSIPQSCSYNSASGAAEFLVLMIDSLGVRVRFRDFVAEATNLEIALHLAGGTDVVVCLAIKVYNHGYNRRVILISILYAYFTDEAVE